MPTFTSDQLERVGQGVLEALGTPTDLAALVSHSLVESNLVGHDSHGIIRLMEYTGNVRAGQVKPDARCRVIRQTGAMAVVDGAFGWGQAAAQAAARTAITLAEEFGVGAVTITHCNHVGRLGEYVDMMARAGCIGMALANVGAGVAPFGGRTRLLGTNPMAYAVPLRNECDSVLVDFATSSVAEGKLRVSYDKGEHVPPGLIIDKDGNPTTDPSAFYDGGALLPFGGHKGYSLSVMCELIGGALSGMAPSCLPEFGGGNGPLFVTLKVAAFVPEAQFTDQAERFSEAIKAAPTANGVSAVMMPGEPEWNARRHRLAHGIQLPDRTWDDISQLTHELSVDVTIWAD
jgi:uncharacterized oxidoreductase